MRDISVTSPNLNLLDLATTFASYYLSQISSQDAKVIPLFAFALDLATTFCFLLFQDIKLLPIKTQ